MNAWKSGLAPKTTASRALRCRWGEERDNRAATAGGRPLVLLRAEEEEDEEQDEDEEDEEQDEEEEEDEEDEEEDDDMGAQTQVLAVRESESGDGEGRRCSSGTLARPPQEGVHVRSNGERCSGGAVNWRLGLVVTRPGLALRYSLGSVWIGVLACGAGWLARRRDCWRS